MFFAHDGRGPLLVGRVDPGEQEAHRDRLHPLVTEPAGGAPHRLLVERNEDFAGRRSDALGHREPVPPAHERPVLPRDFLPDRVVLGPLVAADVDDVAVARARDHPGPRAVVGEDRIGRDGGAVEQVPDLGRGEPLPLAEFAHCGLHAERRVFGSRRDLVDADVVRRGIGKDHVGERPADIDPDEFHDVSRPPGWVKQAYGKGRRLPKYLQRRSVVAEPGWRRFPGEGGYAACPAPASRFAHRFPASPPMNPAMRSSAVSATLASDKHQPRHVRLAEPGCA